MKRILLLVLFSLIMQQSFAQKPIKIWIVRHAEKDVSDTKDPDPELSAVGGQRAEALMKTLKGKNVDSIFVTQYKRTKLTAFPLSDKIGLPMKVYNPSKQKEFAEGLLKHAEGKKVLVVGHSNTVLELIEAFGAKKPVGELSDDDYDYLFEVNVSAKKADVSVSHYGEPHHKETKEK